jgi:hypothetical protein
MKPWNGKKITISEHSCFITFVPDVEIIEKDDKPN